MDKKNIFIGSLYFYATVNLNIDVITQKFLAVRHTQQEGDAAHFVRKKTN